MSGIPKCDCEVVDDPDQVCPTHQAKLYEYVRSLESILATERDAWGERETELMAENNKLKEILKTIRDTSGYSDDTFDQFRKLAKEALAEFEGKK